MLSTKRHHYELKPFCKASPNSRPWHSGGDGDTVTRIPAASDESEREARLQRLRTRVIPPSSSLRFALFSDLGPWHLTASAARARSAAGSRPAVLGQAVIRAPARAVKGRGLGAFGRCAREGPSRAGTRIAPLAAQQRRRRPGR